MLTIKMWCDIEKLNRESKLPISLVQFLEKTFRELHEAYESETEIALFSLDILGPIILLEVEDSYHKIMLALRNLEYVEKILLADLNEIWRIGVMADNSCFMTYLAPVGGLQGEVESWLEELSEPLIL